MLCTSNLVCFVNIISQAFFPQHNVVSGCVPAKPELIQVLIQVNQVFALSVAKAVARHSKLEGRRPVPLHELAAITVLNIFQQLNVTLPSCANSVACFRFK